MTKTHASVLLVASLAVGACFVSGCAAKSGDSSASSSDDITAMNDPKAEADAVTVAPDSITFPGSVAKTERVADLTTRTVDQQTVFLVGQRATDAVLPDGTINAASKNPNGYLRKVVSVKTLPNGDTQFMTAPASLVEAKAEMQAKGMMPADASNSSDCFPQATNAFNLYNIDLSRSLYSQSFGSIGSMNIALKNTSLSVTGNLDTQVAGSCYGPDAAHALLTLNLQGGVTLEGNFSGAFGSETGSLPLYHKQIAITSVAGYPLALDFSVSADCNFASNGKAVADVGASIAGTVTAGGTWQSGQGFSTVFKPQWPQANAIGPSFSTNSTIEGKCTLSVVGKALIFDSTDGPTATADAWLELDGTGSGAGATTTGVGGSVEAKLTAGVDLGLSGTLKPFDYTILDNISAPSYSPSWTLFDKTFSVTP